MLQNVKTDLTPQSSCSHDRHDNNKNNNRIDMATTYSSFVSALPFELVAAIFNMLTMEQNVCCTQVCHTWRSFILSSWGGLWQELSDSNCNFVQDLTPYHISGRQVKILEMNARKRRKQSKEINFLVSRKCHHIQAGTIHILYLSMLFISYYNHHYYYSYWCCCYYSNCYCHVIFYVYV